MYLTKAAICGQTGITERQFDRWRTAGLLPRPNVRHLGRKGTAVNYPEEAVERIEMLRGREWQALSLDDQLVRLWVVGYDVEANRVRDVLAGILAATLSDAKAIRWRKGRSAFADRVARVVEPEVRSQLSRGLRGESDRISFITAVVAQVAGYKMLYESSSQPCGSGRESTLSDIVLRGLNLLSWPGASLLTARTPNRGDLPTQTPADMTLEALPSGQAVHNAINTATDSEMESARHMLKALARLAGVLTLFVGPAYSQGIDTLTWLVKPTTLQVAAFTGAILHLAHQARGDDFVNFCSAMDAMPEAMTQVLEQSRVRQRAASPT